MVEEYDPSTNSWTRKADMPTARALLTVEAVGGSLYAIGGAVTDWTTLDAVEALTLQTPS